MNSTQLKETVLILVFALVIIASGADLVADLSHGADRGHLLREALIVAISILAIAWLLWGLRQQRLEIRQLRAELAAASASLATPERYVLDARKTLGSVITRQFADWRLTASEQEIGRLLLKGLSLREIAAVRDTQEKTVRQQASSIYRKAGIGGRHAFSAWFIEDIL